MKHIFLVLNYNSYQETINMIESLYKMDIDFYKVIIVDNGSRNDSVLKLGEIYKNENDIVLVETKKNLGFGKGNNFGLDYIKSNYNDFDFIHCSNSDILISDKNILKHVENTFKKEEFYLYGPNVMTNGKASSPLGVMNEKEDFIKYINNMEFMTEVYSKIVFLFDKFMTGRLERTYQSYNSKKIINQLENGKQIVPILSGCYLVFSKKFTNYYDKLFSDITFLYNEEAILTYTLLCDNNANIVFDNNNTVIHKHAGSSKGNNKNKVGYSRENTKLMRKLYDANQAMLEGKDV